MKKLLMILPLVILLCFTFGCQAYEEKPAVDIEAEKAAVKTVLDEWIQCFETKDMELGSKIIAHDDDLVVFGTDAAEHFIGWEPFKESLQKQFDAAENVDASIREELVKVHKSGEVAWISCLLDMEVTSLGESFSLEGMRLTGVMEKRNGNWVIVQIHASVPVAGQAVKY
jgi:ketosteroid isomerase-like protein